MSREPLADRRDLHQVIAAYLDAVERGGVPDRKAWLARYPQFAAQLAEFLAAQDRVDRLVNPPGLAPTETLAPPATEYGGAGASCGAVESLASPCAWVLQSRGKHRSTAHAYLKRAVELDANRYVIDRGVSMTTINE